jgi:hypothetical protein
MTTNAQPTFRLEHIVSGPYITRPLGKTMAQSKLHMLEGEPESGVNTDGGFEPAERRDGKAHCTSEFSQAIVEWRMCLRRRCRAEKTDGI